MKNVNVFYFFVPQSTGLTKAGIWNGKSSKVTDIVIKGENENKSLAKSRWCELFELGSLRIEIGRRKVNK